jgi:hypothetical protein
MMELSEEEYQSLWRSSMTNSILNPIVSLDPFLYVSGKEISNDADALVNLGKMQNYLHAHYGAGVMIEQKFDDGILFYNSSTPKIACYWRMPTISTAHKVFQITVNAQAHTGSNYVYVTITAGASNATLTLNLTPSTTDYYQGSITFASIADSTSYMLVQMIVQGHLQVNSICVEALPLSSVSDGAIYQPNGGGYFYPIGDDAFISDKPLSSAKGRQLLSNLRLLQKRPRMLFTASAIDVGADGGTTNTFNGGSIHPQKTFSYQDLIAMTPNLPQWEGAITLNLNLVINMYVINPSAYDYEFYLWSNKIVVDAGETGKWISILTKYPSSFDAFLVNLTYRLRPLRINPLLSVDALDPTLISSPIQSISLWGA